MPTLEFHLFRTKFIRPAQGLLFTADLTAQDIFESCLKERPSLELRKNNVWHIGNVEHLVPYGGRFAIGRTTKTTIEKFDQNSGNFTELIDDSGPYTYVYFDSRIGLLGIGKKSKVAADVKAIARKIQKLLARTKLVTYNKIDVRVDFIPDPQGFIEKVSNAYAVKRFKTHFTGPNPIDADELFQKPMSYYCQQLDGQQGSVVVSGEALNDEVIVAVAKSTAATGNGASALIQVDRGSRPTSISFRGDAAKVVVAQDAEVEETLSAIQQAYREIRE